MITRNRSINHGALTIDGTRVQVHMILWVLSDSDAAIEAVQREYPHLTPEQIQVAIQYAAEELELEKDI